MNEEELRFENDKLYHYYPLPQYGEGIAKKDLVMTKEVFVECFKKWILANNEDRADPNVVHISRSAWMRMSEEERAKCGPCISFIEEEELQKDIDIDEIVCIYRNIME